MDLLKGYGSDSDASSSSSSSNEAATNSAKAKTTATAAKVVVAASKPPQSKTKTPLPNNKNKPTTKKNRGGGKRILSLGAVLPPEIFDRLTRPPEEDDSSTSSFEGAQSKKRKRRPADNDNKDVGVQSSGNGGADRSELNSLLSELRSTPLHVSTKDKKSASGSGKKKQDSAPKTKEVQDEGKLGMAFMSYTSSTTTTTKKSEISEVVNVHASKSAAKKKSIHQPFYTGGAAEPKKKSPPPAVPKPVVPSFTRISGAAPVVKSSVNNSQYSPHGASSMPQYPVTQQEQETNGMNIMEQQAPTTAAASHHNMAESSFNNNNSTGLPKSRKQKREEERALRSGQAFNNPSATELYQPAPAEFAPSAHAAAIASNAARKIGHAQGGGGSVKNIAMYDPSTGGDVKGLGVTGKHRSKHQINQLMASAISLEAHRASESELARFGAGTGGGGKGSRVDAKKKYGW